MGKAALQAWREQRDAPRRPRAPRPGTRRHALEQRLGRDWLHVVPEEPPAHQRPRTKPTSAGTTQLHDQIERLWIENDRLKRELAKVERLFRHATEYVLDKVRTLQ